MTKRILFLLFTISIGYVNSQVGVGTTSPDASSVLEVQSTTQGMLTPRMISSQRTSISTPATGLIVYQTDGIAGFYYYTGSTWVVLINGSDALPAVNGSAVTNLNASNLSSGTVPTARLGSGTADNSTYLRGDGTWSTPGGASSKKYGQIRMTGNGTISGGLEGGSANTIGAEVSLGDDTTPITVENGVLWNSATKTFLINNEGDYEINVNSILEHVKRDVWATYVTTRIYVNNTEVFNSEPILFPIWGVSVDRTINNYNLFKRLFAGDVVNVTIQYQGQGEGVRLISGSTISIKQL